MPKRTNKANRLSFVSKRYYALLSNDSTGRYVIDYYRNTLKRYANTDCPTGDLFKMMYGTHWYNQPFSKLYKLLKLADNGEYKGTSLQKLDRHDVMRIHTMLRKYDGMQDMSVTRICKRFYPAKLVNEIIDTHTPHNMQCNYFGTTDQVLNDLAKFAAYVKKYDKQSIKQLKKVRTVSELTSIANKAGDVAKYKRGCYGRDLAESMTLKQRDELTTRAIRASIKTVLGTKCEKELGSIEDAMLSEQGWAYSRTTFGGCPSAMQRVFNKAAQITRELDKLYNAESILDELRLENAFPSECGWRRERRVSGKLYTTLKHLKKEYEKGMPLEIVQAVAIKHSGLIHRENYNNRVWAPELCKKEDI